MVTRAPLLSILLVLSVAACDAHEQLDGSQHALGGSDSGQGRSLLGASYPAPNLMLPPHPYLHGDLSGSGYTLANGYLADMAGNPLSSGSFDASDGGVFQIMAARPVPGTSMYEYRLDHISPASGPSPVPLCDGAWAIPVWGRWLSDGANVRDAARHWVSFSCSDGVIAKCQSWDVSSWSSPLEHHACTRAALHDVCGTGKTRTMDGTQILAYETAPFVPNGFYHSITELFDRSYGPNLGRWLGVPPDSASSVTSGTRWFEAGWSADAHIAVTGDKTTYSGQAVCLSKLRWSTMPLGGHCPGALPDPRLSPSPNDKFCEDYSSIGDLEYLAGAVLATESYYNDDVLLTWTMPGGHPFTTTEGNQTTSPDGTTGTPSDHLGMVFTDNGRDVMIDSGVYDESAFALLSSWHKDDGAGNLMYATTIDVPSAAGYSLAAPVGWILIDEAAASDFESKSDARKQALYLYVDSATSTYITTLSPPSGVSATRLGYTMQPQ